MNILIASTTKIKATNVNDKFEKRVNLCGFEAFYEYLFTLHLWVIVFYKTYHKGSS